MSGSLKYIYIYQVLSGSLKYKMHYTVYFFILVEGCSAELLSQLLAQSQPGDVRMADENRTVVDTQTAATLAPVTPAPAAVTGKIVFIHIFLLYWYLVKLISLLVFGVFLFCFFRPSTVR